MVKRYNKWRVHEILRADVWGEVEGMKVLITGANGQLGHDVVGELKKKRDKILWRYKERF